MSIRIVEGPDPLSDAALASDDERVVRHAASESGRVLRLELERYCRGEINGRSFLIAGHRGAGKTTMVADAIDKVLRHSRNPGRRLMRPLPVFLHGPSLFEADDVGAADRAKPDAPADAEAGAKDGARPDARIDVNVRIDVDGKGRASVDPKGDADRDGRADPTSEAQGVAQGIAPGAAPGAAQGAALGVAEGRASGHSTGPSKGVAPGDEKSPSSGDEAFGAKDASRGASPNAAGSAAGAGASAGASAGAGDPHEMAAQARAALTQILLGLHRAVVKEFTRAYRARVVDGVDFRRRPDGVRREFAELAAQFEVELAAGAPAARLREFWERAESLGAGVLAEAPRTEDEAEIRRREVDRGALELVAVNGMCDAHQRISGSLQGQERMQRSDEQVREAMRGTSIRGSELVSPVVSVLSGVAVAGGAAAQAHGVGGPMLAGLVAALASSLLFKASTTRTTKSGRQSDLTFIPDLSLKTLDRVLPTLIQRLRDAGLAPVLVIDELDKVEGLSLRLVAMIHFLKKLVAENVFTCFLTDRGYLEELNVAGGSGAYGRAYSYFSHPLLVSFRPMDFDRFLADLLRVDPLPRVAAFDGDGAAPRTSEDDASDEAREAARQRAPALPPDVLAAHDADQLDAEVLRWVLRFRSELHALTLSREIAALRGDGGVVQLAPGVVRTDPIYRIAATFQVAIELHLAQPHVAAWLRLQPERAQRVFDAAYFLVREWKTGRAAPRLGRDGAFLDYLVARLNLDVPVMPEVAFPDDDRKLLHGIVEDMVAFLQEGVDGAAVRKRWDDLPPADRSPHVSPPLSVVQAMLLGEESLLVRETDAATGHVTLEWRYRPSGALRDGPLARQAAKVAWMEARAGQPAAPSAPADAAGPGGEGGGVSPAPRALTGDVSSTSAMSPRVERALDAAREIVALAKRLAPLLASTPVQVPDADVVYELLADRLRILPTSPAWPPVRSAIENLELARSGGGRPSTHDQDAQTVLAFREMLRENEALVAEVLLLAAFLSGAASAYIDALPVTPAGARVILREVVTLTVGLRFAHRDGASSRGSLRQAADQLAALAPAQFDPIFGATLDETFPSRLDDAWTWGSGQFGSVARAVVIDGAWAALRQRLEIEANRRVVANAQGVELLAFAIRSGPARLFDLELSATRLGEWTTAMLLAAGITKEPVKPEHAVPEWIVGHALRRLGAGSLSPEVIDRLLAWLDLPSTAKELRNDYGYLVATSALPDAERKSGPRPVALCVTAPGIDLMREWRVPPRLGFVMVLTGNQLALLAQRRFGIVFEPPLVVAAAQIGDGTTTLPQQMVQLGRAEPDVTEVRVYRAPIRSMRAPYVVAPAEADDLLATVRAPSTPM